MKFYLGTFLNNGQEHLGQTIVETEEYIKKNSELCEVIDSHHMAFRRIYDLIPQTVDKVFSGNLFPYFEAESELEASILFARNGFYKHALLSLRNLLELCLLSAYWDVDGKSHVDIKPWLSARVDTPFKRQLRNKLLEHPNIKLIDKKHQYFESVNELYLDLSNYTHTKGVKHSSRHLNRTNINVFNETAFLGSEQKKAYQDELRSYMDMQENYLAKKRSNLRNHKQQIDYLLDAVSNL